MPKMWLVKLPGVAVLTHTAGSVSEYACRKAPCGNTFRLQLHLAFPVDKKLWRKARGIWIKLVLIL